MSAYDCTKDVEEHRRHVSNFMSEAIISLTERAHKHDASKLQEPEKSMYDEFKPRISAVEKEYGYGSPQYEQVVKDMGETLKVHFRNNSHHPEHYINGIDGMSLLDLLEALCDWQAAASKSGQAVNIEANAKRFKMSPQLAQIFKNTLAELW